MRFLVLNHSFRDLHGSEINALQLCTALKARGHTADLGTFETGRPMNGLAAARRIAVLDLSGDAADSLDYDVIWAHHAPVLTHVLFRKKTGDCRLLFSSLSPLTAMESPPSFLADISCYLTHSPYNHEYLIGLGLPPASIRYFPNFAPAEFFGRPRAPRSGRWRRMAVVSNHPPAEVTAMAALARRDGMRVDFIGGSRAVYIDETILPDYDLVVSIGKTAVYCFAQKIPYYCYDHFGGPGYVGAGNFERARHGNFCGRSFWRKLSAADMYREITDGYAAAAAGVDFLHARAREQFCLETNLANLEEVIATIPVTKIAELIRRHPVAGRLNDIYMGSLRHRLSYEKTLAWRAMHPLRTLKHWWRERAHAR